MNFSMRVILIASMLGGIAACTTATSTISPDNAARATAIAKLTGSASAGSVVYSSTGRCLSCHGADGKGQPEVDLAEPAKNDPVAGLAGYVLNGIAPKMPSASSLSDQQIADVVAYLKATYGK